MFTSYWLLQFFLTGMELLLYDWGKELFQNWLFTISVTSVCHVSFTHWTGTAERYDDNLPWGEIIVLEISFICQSVSHRSSCCCYFFILFLIAVTELNCFCLFILLLSRFFPHSSVGPTSYEWCITYVKVLPVMFPISLEITEDFVSYPSPTFVPLGGKKALIWDL